MRWVIISSLAMFGLADLIVLNLVAIPRYQDELQGASGEIAQVTEPVDVATPASNEAPPRQESNPPIGVEPAEPEEPPQGETPEVEAPTEPETAAQPEAGTEPEAPPIVEPPPEPEAPEPPAIEPPLPAEPEAQPSPTVTQPATNTAAPLLEPAYFATGSSGLRSYVQEHLRHAVVVMRRDPSLRVMLRGHSDSRGLEGDNLGLSRSRAQAVADFLVQQGISRQRIVIEGVGESQPVSAGEGAEDWAKNRRVEVIWR